MTNPPNIEALSHNGLIFSLWVNIICYNNHNNNIMLYTLKLLIIPMDDKKTKKQPKRKEKPVIEPDIIIRKVFWTPPEIIFKPKQGIGRKPNVKCVYCGKEYYKQGAKSNLKVCKECIRRNEYRKAPPSFMHLSGGTNNTAIGYDPAKEQKEPKIELPNEKQQVITRKPCEMDLFEDYDSDKEQANEQKKQDIINKKNQETSNEVNRIILGLLPETPEPKQKQISHN